MAIRKEQAVNVATFIGQAAKAFLAGILAALAALGGFLVNDTTLGQITAGQWVFVAIAGLVALGGVYGISNKTA